MPRGRPRQETTSAPVAPPERFHVRTDIEPEVVGTREAQRMGGWGKTTLFKLIRDRELESFMDGSVRRITTRSIHARIARKLQENGFTTETALPAKSTGGAS